MAEAGSTLCVDFSKLPTQFEMQAMLAFIANQLELQHDVLSRVHFRPTTRNVHIDIRDVSAALQVLTEQDPNRVLVYDGKTYPVPITLGDGSIIVKLHDVSPRVTSRDIVQHMSRYGTVIGESEGRWAPNTLFAGLLNGYRYVRLIATALIPHYMEIGGEPTYASYHGEPLSWRGREQRTNYGLERPPRVSRPIVPNIPATTMKVEPADQQHSMSLAPSCSYAVSDEQPSSSTSSSPFMVKRSAQIALPEQSSSQHAKIKCTPYRRTEGNQQHED